MLAKVFKKYQASGVTALPLRPFSLDPKSGQFHLLLFGAPGVGKGTYSKLIEKDFDFPTFSMGDYFRSIINDPKAEYNLFNLQGCFVFLLQDDFLKSVKNILRSGKLVDDQTVIDVIKNIKQSKKYDKHTGMIFDGVPRTLHQAEMIRKFMKIDLVINFYNREDILLEKLMSRRVCPSCGKNYNIANINRDILNQQ